MNSGMVWFILTDLAMSVILTLGVAGYLVYRDEWYGITKLDIIIAAMVLFIAWSSKIAGTGW